MAAADNTWWDEGCLHTGCSDYLQCTFKLRCLDYHLLYFGWMASIIVKKKKPFPLNMYVLVINGLVFILQCSPVVNVS